MAVILYPRTYFLGMISEGMTDMTQSEKYYLRYLEKKPHHKRTLLRLASLYEKMGFPNKAFPLLQKLYHDRSQDREVMEAYLNFLENTHRTSEIQKTRLEIVNTLESLKKPPRHRIASLLDDSLQYALWVQNIDQAYSLTLKLIHFSDKPELYRPLLDDLDRGLKNTEKMVAKLEENFKKAPGNIFTRSELISIYLVLKRYEEALRLIDYGLVENPKAYSLLRQRVEIDERRGDVEQAIQDLNRLLEINIPLTEREDVLLKLASLYSKSGQALLSLSIYKNLTQYFPNNKSYWEDRIYTLTGMKEWDQALSVLDEYQKIFPDDPQIQKVRIDFLLYQLKLSDPATLQLYRVFIQKYGDEKIAGDVTNLLIDHHRFQEALHWIHDISAWIPPSKLFESLLYCYLEMKNNQAALDLIRPLAAVNNIKYVRLAASLLGELNRPEEALIYWKKLAVLDPRAEIFLFVGKELFFQGESEEARELLLKATDKNLSPSLSAHQGFGVDETKVSSKEGVGSLKIETYYWLMEVELALENKKASRDAAKRVILEARSRQNLSSLEERFYIKAKGRLHWNKHLASDYQVYFKKYPKETEALFDWMDLLLEKQKTKKVREILLTQQNVITAHTKELALTAIQKRLSLVWARVFLIEEKWKKALPLLLKEQETSPLIQRDLASVYEKLGQWKKSFLEYENIQNRNFTIDLLLQEMHKKYDHRIQSDFSFLDLGSDRLFSEKISYRGYLSEPLRLDLKTSFFKDQIPNLSNDKAASFEATLAYKPWTSTEVSLGALMGTSSERTAPGLKLGMTSTPHSNFNLEMNFAFHELRSDIPRALKAGTLWDHLQISGNYTFLKRVITSLSYELERNLLESGEKSTGHQISPGIAVTLWNKPFVSLGYQFQWVKQNGPNSFFQQLPLLKESQVHYLTGSFSQKINPALSIETGFFLGEDTKRNLHLFQGDLWGARGGLDWKITPNLDLTASYNFGRETLQGIGGESHSGTLSISGHWK